MGDTLLASAGDDIKLWDVNGYEFVKQYNPHDGNVTSLCWSHDNTALASAASVGDKIVLAYTNAGLYTKEVSVGDKCTCVAFNSNSRYIMGGGGNGHIHVWDLKTQKLKKSYKDHKEAVTSLQFNWNDTVIASGSQSGEIILYNVVTGLGYTPLIAPKVQAIRQVQYSHFKKSLLASVSDDGAVNMWDTNTKRLLQSYNDTHKAPATALAFSPLNEMLMMSVGLDKHIVCYDVQGKKAVKTMTAESPLTSIDVFIDGTTLAVGTTRGKIYLYDLRSADEPFKILTAHKSSVQNLKFQYNINETKNGGGPGSAKPARRAMSNPAVQAKRAQLEAANNNNNMRTSPKANMTKETNGMSSAKSVPELRRGDKTNRVNFADLPDSGSPAESFPSRRRGSDHSAEIVSPLRDTTGKTSKTPPQNASGLAESHVDRLGYVEAEHGRFSSEIFSPLAASQSSNRSNNHPSSPMTDLLSMSIPMSMREGTQPIDEQNMPVQSSESGPSGPRTRRSDERVSPGFQHSPRQTSVQNQRVRAGTSSLSSSQEEGSFTALGSRGFPPESPGTRARQNANYASRSDAGFGRKSSSSLSPQSDMMEYAGHTSAGDTEADSAPVQRLGGEHGAVGADPPPESAVSPFHVRFIRNVVEDAMDDFRDQVKRDILNLHMEMLKQFQIQQTEVRAMLQHYSVNEQLISEIERLKEENRKLKKKF